MKIRSNLLPPSWFFNRLCISPRMAQCAGALALTFGAAGVTLATTAAKLEDPLARAALPEFKTMPAAKTAELTPALDPAGSAPLFSRWTRSQGDNGARRYSALNQITRDNVRDLAVAWTFRSGDGAANVQCTPIVVDGVLYAPTPGRALVAIDAATGVERWRKQLEAPRPTRLQDAPARRGLVYWPGDRENAARILFGAGDWIYAVDPKTGGAIAGLGGALFFARCCRSA